MTNHLENSKVQDAQGQEAAAQANGTMEDGVLANEVQEGAAEDASLDDSMTQETGFQEGQLAGSKTLDNLKEAFSGESQANRRYLYFAERAELEGHKEIAHLFRETAEGETGHAHGHIDFMACVGDPATGCPIGTTRENLKAAIEGETHEYTDMYPGMARTAREEGFDEIAQWFETLAKAERSHARRFQEALAQYFGG